MLIICSSLLLCLHLLTNAGRPTTFDGHIHITTMVQFAESLAAGEVPAWSQGFANYGYPLALIAHQLPAYVGAFLVMMGMNPETVFKLGILGSTLLSGIGMYIFMLCLLSSHDNPRLSRYSALLSTILWIFSSYRAMNIYSRGALPELAAAAILPFLLLCILKFLATSHARYLLTMGILTLLLAITHPMVLVPATPLILATYFSNRKQNSRPISVVNTVALSVVFVLAILTASYYLVPLHFELKYFYQGFSKAVIGSSTYLSVNNLLTWYWPYFPLNDHPGPRVGPIQFGVVEIAILVVGLVISLRSYHRKNSSLIKLMLVWVVAGGSGVLMTTRVAQPLYDSVNLLANIQYPWRFLLTFHFASGVIIGLLASYFRLSRRIILILLIILVLLRLPEAYGKNFVSLSKSDYQFNRENLHSANLNPIWAGDTKDYQIQKSLFSVIEGTGVVAVVKERPSSREYNFNAATDSRISFNTFFFPGWKLFVNNQPQDIQFQDPNYRGVMTTKLTAGDHKVLLTYTDTRARKLAKYLSLTAILLMTLSIIVYIIVASRIRSTGRDSANFRIW